MLKDKALENLAAGELLLDRGLVNAATSRFYYAMFQAAVCRFSVLGILPGALQSGVARWHHAVVANNTWLLRNRREDRRLYNHVLESRKQADYDDLPVPTAIVSMLGPEIREFVLEMTK